MGNFSDEVLKSLSEKEGEVSERVIRNVRYLFKKSGSQADFCRFCKDKYNTKVNQGNLSKMLNQKTNRVTPLLVIMLSRYFGVDLEELLLKEFSPMDAILENVVGRNPEDPRLVIEATDYHFDNCTKPLARRLAPVTFFPLLSQKRVAVFAFMLYC